MLVRLKEYEGESARYCEGDSRIISTGDVTGPFQIFSGSQLLSDFQTFFNWKLWLSSNCTKSFMGRKGPFQCFYKFWSFVYFLTSKKPQQQDMDDNKMWEALCSFKECGLLKYFYFSKTCSSSQMIWHIDSGTIGVCD